MKLMPFVRRFVPRSATAVEEPGYHLAPGHAVCPHCESIYNSDGIDELAVELDCCTSERCKLKAIGERKRAVEELGILAARWRRSEPTLRMLANLQPSTDELVQLVMFSNLRIAARQIIGWCELCQARQSIDGKKICAECKAVLRGVQFEEGRFNG